MPKNARCAVGCCDNDKRYPEHLVKRSHVEELVFHKWPKNEHLAGIWLKQLKKGRSDELARKERLFVHFPFPRGKRTPKNPETDFPSLFLTISDYVHSVSPKKRKTRRRPELHEDTDTQSDTSHDEDWEMPEHSDINSSSSEGDPSTIPMRLEQLT